MMSEPIKNLTMMLYTDGSAGGAPSGQLPCIGMGYHGYYFVNNEPNDKKSADVPKTGYPSKYGYVGPDNETDFAKYNKDHIKVVPVGYLDGYVATTKDKGYSNEAEIFAIKYALDNVRDYFTTPINGVLTEINVFSDSVYALLIYERALKHIKEHPEWLTDDQTRNLQLDVLYKTPGTREKVEKSMFYLKDYLDNFPGLKLEFSKVAGHAGNIGNEQADKLAVTGRKASERKEDKHIFNWAANKYWKPNVERHPFLRYKELFFAHNVEENEVDSNHGYYTVMNYGSIEPGKRSGEPIYGIVHIDEPPTILRELVNTYNVVNADRPILMYAVDMDKLYAQDLQRNLVAFGVNAFTFNNFNQMLLLDTDSMVYPIYPPGLAKKAYDETQGLTGILEQAKLDIANNNLIGKNKFYIDITDKIYGLNDKKRQVCLLPNPTNSLPLEVTLDNEKMKMHLYMDKDILNRNMLKSMENDDVKVYVLFTRQGRLYYNYYTIIINKTLNAEGIWTNIFASKIFLEDSKHQEEFKVEKKKGKK